MIDSLHGNIAPNREGDQNVPTRGELNLFYEKNADNVGFSEKHLKVASDLKKLPNGAGMVALQELNGAFNNPDKTQSGMRQAVAKAERVLHTIRSESGADDKVEPPDTRGLRAGSTHSIDSTQPNRVGSHDETDDRPQSFVRRNSGKIGATAGAVVGVGAAALASTVGHLLVGPGGWALAAIIPGIIGSIIARRAANRQGPVMPQDREREEGKPNTHPAGLTSANPKALQKEEIEPAAIVVEKFDDEATAGRSCVGSTLSSSSDGTNFLHRFPGAPQDTIGDDARETSVLPNLDPSQAEFLYLQDFIEVGLNEEQLLAIKEEIEEGRIKDEYNEQELLSAKQKDSLVGRINQLLAILDKPKSDVNH